MCGRSDRVTRAPALARAMPTMPAGMMGSVKQEIFLHALSLRERHRQGFEPPSNCPKPDSSWRSLFLLSDTLFTAQATQLCNLRGQAEAPTCASAEIKDLDACPVPKRRVLDEEVCQQETALPHHLAHVLQLCACCGWPDALIGVQFSLRALQAAGLALCDTGAAAVRRLLQTTRVAALGVYKCWTAKWLSTQ